MFKNFCVFALGATVGAVAYHLVTKAAEVVVETVTDTVVS